MSRTLVALAAVSVVLVAGLLTWTLAPRFLPGLRASARSQAHLPTLDLPATWWNGGPFPDDSLAGRPVVVLLWSEADPRTPAALATLQAWHAAYAPLGVHVLAVHVPEFRFADDSAVVGRMVRREKLSFPVASDPAGRFAASFGGATEGPHLVVADERGVLAVDTVAAMAPGDAALRAWAARAAGVGATPPVLATPDFPPVRMVRLGAGESREGPLVGLPAGHEEVFTAEFRYQEQGRAWAPFPVGGWRVRADGLEATRGGAANFIAIRYSAGRAGVVVSPPPGASARLWVLVDDQWPREEARGADVAADGRGAAYLEFAEPGLYWIEQGRGERVLKLSPDRPGVTLHALVFEGAHE
jgi:hypothetical protein